MKLINPNNDELNAAFAEKVCGWMWRQERGPAWYVQSDDPDPYKWIRICGPKGGDIMLDGGLRFATSADAVIPFLERQQEGYGVDFDTEARCYFVTLCSSDIDAVIGISHSFARAACIALLRSKGVTITT